MEKNNLDKLFIDLEGTFDFEEPNNGHQHRFLEKLENSKNGPKQSQLGFSWWKPLSIAASVVIIFAIGQSKLNPSIEEQVAEISPEVSNTQFYFASLIEEQVKELEAEEAPETKQIIADTLNQLATLQMDYKSLEKDLLSGGNSKLILSAMITNYQTRIDLLSDVMQQIENIKTLKNTENANLTI
ncbi:hypothetical protein ACOCEA_12795 [Maribacter sp. CXY002]|uniref:hypothetical protein n=1 Tax=Maribacter luteocoastalis TaxID=3407671 RepID=UPI003B6762D1